VNPTPSTTLEAESLATLIHEQSAAEAEAIVEQGRERAERIRAAGAAQIEQIEAGARDEGNARGRREAAQLLAGAEAECQRRYLQARERLIDDTMVRARERLAAFPTQSGAAAILERLIAEGLRVLPPGPVRVLMPDTYAGLLDSTALARLGGARLQIQTQADFPPGGGVVLETDDGRLRFDNSFDARISRLSDRIRCAVAAARRIAQPATVSRPDERP